MSRIGIATSVRLRRTDAGRRRLGAATLAGVLAVLAACGHDGSDESGGTARPCFNPALYRAGASLIAVYRPTDAETGLPIAPDFVQTSSVAVATFGPVPDTLDLFVVGGRLGNSASHQYFQLDGPTVVLYGVALEEGVPGDTATRYAATYRPPLRSALDFSLRAGESRTETYEVVSNDGRSQPASATIRFVGFDDVTTPAGRFAAACRFAWPSSNDGIDTTTEAWFARDSGVAIRSTAVSLVYETVDGEIVVRPVREDRRLVLAALNGALVTPGGAVTP